MAKIFISYSTQEDKTAHTVAQWLAHFGENCFWAGKEGSIPYGTPDYWTFLEGKVSECETFFFLASKSSLSSANVRREVGLAKKYNKRIMPLCLGIPPEQLTPLLGNVQAVDGTNANAVFAAFGQLAGESKNQAFSDGVAAAAVLAGLAGLAGLVLSLAFSRD
jgi:hypothetical protein